MLAIVSFFNDIASEATLRLLPLFLSQVLGTSTIAIGLIEGLAESTATLLKLLSGWISDRLPRRKPLVLAGYSFSAVTRPLLLLATTWPWVLFIRFADRVGKGIRTAPRDALIADESQANKRGHSFGLNRALDTAGALVGLAIAYAVVANSETLTRAAFNKVILIALVPAALSILVLTFGIKEQARATNAVAGTQPLPGARPKMPREFWLYMVVVSAFTLSNSSDAFLVLKAARTRGGIGFVLICLMVMNVSGAALAIPAGKLSDVIGRKQLIVAGWLVYALAYAGFALSSSHAPLLALFFFYGAFYGLADGVERSFIADLVPEGQGRGFAYGVFSFVVGVMSFPASLLFGLALARWGEQTSFLADAAIATAATVGLIFFVPEKKR